MTHNPAHPFPSCEGEPMQTATQILIVSQHESRRLPLSAPRTLHEVDALIRRVVLKHGGDASALVVSLPVGSSTAIVNL
jgi:hypothetical protein